MRLLYAIFFGAAVATFIYTKSDRRLGADNAKSTWVVTGIVFFIATVVFYTILTTLNVD